jgi:hypothetical protein
MINNLDIFRIGVTAYRNVRDWIKEKRDKFIEAANERAITLPQNISFELSHSESSISTNRDIVPESNISVNKFASGRAIIIPRSDKRVKKE